MRQDGAETAARARELWEERRWPLEEIDRLAAAAADGPGRLIGELRFQIERLFSAPYVRQAHVLDAAEKEDARAFEAAVSALDQLGDLRRAGLAKGLDARRLHDTLAELPVRLGERTQPDRVLVATPEQIRARRFEAVFVCGLQEGEFPRGRRPEPFLPDEDRRAIAKASGLVLPVREDELERERYLFYVCASRAERAAFLSSRFSDEEGNPADPARSSSRTLGTCSPRSSRAGARCPTWSGTPRMRPPRWSGSGRSRRSALARRPPVPTGSRQPSCWSGSAAWTRSRPARSRPSPTAR